jgi:ABC-type amino acid transport substrate-binding protein
MKSLFTFGGAALLAGVAALATPAMAQGSGSKTIDDIRAKGALSCGVSTGNAGFSLADSKGIVQGIDADTCRAVAAAILGDGNKVKFVPTTTQNRFTALQSGEVDLLVRSTTWTLGREGNLGLMFAGVNFYDGTGFLIKAATKVKSARELDGATICVQPGTSTELAIADYFRLYKMKFTPVLIQDQNEIQNAYLSGRCDAYSTDLSSLASFRFQQGPKATEHTLQGRRQVLRRRPLDHVRDVSGRGERRDAGQRRRDAEVDQPRYPSPAGRRGRDGQGARPRQSVGREHRQGGGQLRRDVGPHDHPVGDSARNQQSVDQGRAALSAADPLIARASSGR